MSQFTDMKSVVTKMTDANGHPIVGGVIPCSDRASFSWRNLATAFGGVRTEPVAAQPDKVLAI